MAASLSVGSYGTKRCPFCGKPVAVHLQQCPFCREAIPEVHVSAAARAERQATGHNIRRGLLYMLLAAVIYYFSGQYSPFTLPVQVPSFVSMYLAPLLFLGGLGLTGYGLFTRKH